MRLAHIAAAFLPLALILTGCVEEPGDDAGDDGAGDDEAEAEQQGAGHRDEGVAAAAAPIVGGARDEAHAAVVALTFQGQAFCSGTLVAPTVVLTAAHCLHQDFVGDFAIEGVQVFFGTSVAGPGTTIDVAEIVLHPDFRSDDPEQDDDVALLRLAVEAEVAPLGMGGTPDEGTALTVVGYGRERSAVAETGVRRVGTSTLEQVTDDLLVLRAGPHDTCNGDSGGAAIALIGGVEALVGIHTRSDCASGMLEERVDAHFDDFIRPFVGAGATCIGCEPDDDREGGAGGEGAVEADPTDDETEEDDADEVVTQAPFAACAVGSAAGTGTTRATGWAPLALVGAAWLVACRRRGSPRRPGSRTVGGCTAPCSG